MAQLAGLCVVISLLSIASSSQSLSCTKYDYVPQILPCDPRTSTRSVVYYLNSSTCIGGEFPPKPQRGIPCVCTPGKGLKGNSPTNHTCTPCAIGEYGSGGEIINNWRDWTGNGTVPPEGSGLFTYCDISRNLYVKHCDSWKASADNYTLESGDNRGSRCLISVLLMTRKFVLTNNNVSFDYRVDSRDCRPGVIGCDGLGFVIDGQQVLQYQGNQFHWVTKTYNLKKGSHTLKWVFRKRCYSYGYSFLDKAFIRSITLVGTDEPNVKCKPCPPGYFSNQEGASECTACSYFQFQAKEGQTKCDPCPTNTFAMMGASKCIPLPKCTKDDIISAPGNLSTCSCNNTGVCTTTVQEKFVTVTLKDGKGPRILCNRQKNSTITPSSKTVQCRCQPGFEIFQGKDGQIQCKACSKGRFSTGVKCATCKAGHVALPGKHYFLWRNDTLPEGFSASCSGDCTIETGWIPAGDHIRTERVVGNVHSQLRSPEVEVDSDLAKLVFNCSVMCKLTGVPSKPGQGETLAKIENCNLIFQVWKNGSLKDQVNCTRPKGRFTYQHEKRRDGNYITHVYPLEKGRYQFRWTFYQLDDTFSSAFEAKVSNISILGAKSGAARNCTACPPGYHSTPDNTDCKICPNGTSSLAGSDKCAPCQGQTFAAQKGSDRCLPCGSNTKVLPNKDGCDTNGCTFSPAPGVDYDLYALSRPGGSMIKVNLPVLHPWGRRSTYYVNLCTVDHDNSSCTSRDRISGKRVPLPVMACRSSWHNDVSIGSVIGYKRKPDIRSGLIVELLHGDKCTYKGDNRYKTTIDLRCDVTAGVGQPGRESNFSLIEKGCEVRLVWKSLYACPKCREQDITRIKGECINGTRNVTVLRSIPCWAPDEYPGANVTTEECVTPTKFVTVTVTATVLAFREKVSSKVNKILIGVGVVVIVLLLGVALFFVYKHRTIKYRYLNWMSRNKPMSRLEQEDDEDHFIEGDELAYPSNDKDEPFRT